MLIKYLAQYLTHTKFMRLLDISTAVTLPTPLPASRTKASIAKSGVLWEKMLLHSV